MTDKEIIKRLELCSYHECDNRVCAYGNRGSDFEYCGQRLIEDALDLINRQQKVIEEFTLLGKLYSEIRAEAIKEFGEKVKDICRPFPMHDDYECMTIYHQDIDNLVKEMVGADNE